MAAAGMLHGDLRLAGRLDGRFFALLDAIDSTGSINRAARATGYSYKGAWLLLETSANAASVPLVERAVGGRGGTRLTEGARELLATWRQLQARHRDFLRAQEDWLVEQPALVGLLRRIAVKSSARNQFAGTVRAVDWGPVTVQAAVAIASGHEVVATLTRGAGQALQLAPGKDAIVLIKASSIVLVTDFAGYRLSVRNQFAGTLSRLERGAVSSLAVVTLPGGCAFTASVTQEAVEALDLRVGQPCTAVCKAYEVMLAVAT